MGLMRRVILSADDLPTVGVDSEHLAVDFKSDMPNVPVFELAKDVAAFANAAGGTILHRAHEDRQRRVLGRYEPMSSTEAGSVVAAYDHSIRDRCFPSPAWSPARITHDSGIIVAINVQPFPGQVVGVKVRSDVEDGYGDPAYVFPVRAGTQTRFLQPGELAMYMVPEVRMNVVALESIPEQDRERVRLIRRIRGERMMPEDVRLVSVDPERNSVRLGGASYPLNRVGAVWHNGTQWCVIVNYYDMG